MADEDYPIDAPSERFPLDDGSAELVAEQSRPEKEDPRGGRTLFNPPDPDENRWYRARSYRVALADLVRRISSDAMVLASLQMHYIEDQGGIEAPFERVGNRDTLDHLDLAHDNLSEARLNIIRAFRALRAAPLQDGEEAPADGP